MQEIFSLPEAQNFFNSGGTCCKCIKQHHEKICNSLNEAVDFYHVEESEIISIDDSPSSDFGLIDAAVIGMSLLSDDTSSSNDTSSFDFGGGGDGFDGGGASGDW